MAQEQQSWPQRWEDNYPSILSAIATAVGAFMLVRHCAWIQPFVGGVIKLAPSTLNVSAIAVGFLATAEALLLSLGNSKAIVALKEQGHYERLIRFFARGLSASFVAALLSALLTAMRLEFGGAFRNACVGAWCFVGLLRCFVTFVPVACSARSCRRTRGWRSLSLTLLYCKAVRTTLKSSKSEV